MPGYFRRSSSEMEFAIPSCSMMFRSENAPRPSTSFPLNPPRISIRNVGENMCVQSAPARQRLSSMVLPNRGSGLPANGFSKLLARYCTRPARLFPPILWSILAMMLSKLSLSLSTTREFSRSLRLPRFGA